MRNPTQFQTKIRVIPALFKLTISFPFCDPSINRREWYRRPSVSTNAMAFVAVLSTILGTSLAVGQDKPTIDAGAEIYGKQCAQCHGKTGQGGAAYDEPLSGDLSIARLADYISETMPEADPDLCVGEDAKQVAEYIFREFYSPKARAGQTPAKINLSRLTVRQYRESVADIVTHFTSPLWIGEERGLTARYYKSRNFDQKKFVEERIDQQLDFDFQSGSPHQDTPAKEFSMKWYGGLLAPETGYYEIIVESNNGFKLWLNGRKTPLIDHYVTAGNDVHRATIFLLGGRAYPFQVDYFKYNDKTAKFKLFWKRPHGTKTIISNRWWLPHLSHEVAVV